MGWATGYIAKLAAGETVSFRPRGNSMTPKIKSGDLCTVLPVHREIIKGDIVLCKVRNAQYLHLVTAIRGDQYQISNNQGHVNGWITLKNIFGILAAINP